MPRQPIGVERRTAPIRVPAPRRPLDAGTTTVRTPPVPAADPWQQRYLAMSVCTDLAVAVIAAVMAWMIRFGTGGSTMYSRGALVLAPSWVLLVLANRAYERRFIGVGSEEFVRILRAGVALTAGVSVVSYVSKAELSRGYVLIAVPGVILGSLLGRGAQRYRLHRQRPRGHCVHRTLLVGPVADVADTIRRLRDDANHGVTVVSACLTGTGRTGAELSGLDVRTFDVQDLERAVRCTGADVVTVLSTALITGGELRRLAWRLEQLGAELVVSAGLTETAGSRLTIRPTGFLPMLAVSPARLSGAARAVKSVFDRVAAGLGLLVIWPLLTAIAVRIWLQDRRNPFFCQTRIGVNGREFRMLKFRTMVPDAEARKAGLLARNESDGALFKIAEDPRVTAFGGWLRRHSVDELPQLLNVLRGDMSLVGPRPPLPEEVAAYGADMRRRLLVKPGMTGLWQISGRSTLSWARSEQLDIRYVENWSLGSDVCILWRTVRAVWGGTGAY